MKNYSFLARYISSTVVILLFVLTVTGLRADAQENDPVFKVGRLVIAGTVENLEPVGIVNMFSAVTEKVHCFLEAKEIREDTTVSFVWYYGGELKARVELPLRKGPRWRTYSSKKLAGLKGEWRVELRDAGGNIVDTVTFTVE